MRARVPGAGAQVRLRSTCPTGSISPGERVRGIEDLYHCLMNQLTALLLPLVVGLQEARRQAELLLGARPDAFDGDVFIVSGLVEANDDVFERARDDGIGRDICGVGVGHFARNAGLVLGCLGWSGETRAGLDAKPK